MSFPSPLRRVTSGILGSLVVAFWASAGCGGSSPGAPAKSYAPGALGLEEALADLDANEREIASRFGPLPGGAEGKGMAYPQQQSQPTPFPQPPLGPQPGLEPAEPIAPMTRLPEPFPASRPAGAPVPAPPAPPAEPLQAGAPSDALDEEEAAEREREDRCALACRSLGAMRRAAEHVCRTAGSEDARCGGARGRVEAAEQRVSETCDDC